MLDEKGILDNRWLMAHSNMTKADADLYRERGIHYSSTPSTEMQMGLVFPCACFRDDLGVKDLGSLGIDCHGNNSAFMPGEARIGLQGARAARGEVSNVALEGIVRMLISRLDCCRERENTVDCWLQC